MMLNEQYMKEHLQNRVLDAISNRLGHCDTLTQNLIFMLNRTGKKKKKKKKKKN
jgi:hypothetical protein